MNQILFIAEFFFDCQWIETFQNNASKVVNSQTTMCTTGSVIDCTGGINSFCGFSITMEDGFTYYANCPTGYHCNGDICQNNDPAVAQWLYQLAATPIITRCNATGLRVQNGKCQGSCPANLECIDIAMWTDRMSGLEIVKRPSEIMICDQNSYEN